LNKDEFAGLNQDELRRDILAELRGTGSETQTSDEKQDKADGLRLKRILASSESSADDNAFLRAQILAGLRAGLE
jgi:hypothetical protein